MAHDTLIFDVGTSILGIVSAKSGIYVPYYGEERKKGATRLMRAKAIVSYNGKNYDLKVIRRTLGLTDYAPVPSDGIHFDMRSVCWSDRIFGSNLFDTYRMHFQSYPEFPEARDEYEVSNRLDAFMTWKLWECWQRNSLKVLDGQYR